MRERTVTGAEQSRTHKDKYNVSILFPALYHLLVLSQSHFQIHSEYFFGAVDNFQRRLVMFLASIRRVAMASCRYALSYEGRVTTEM